MSSIININLLSLDSFIIEVNARVLGLILLLDVLVAFALVDIIELIIKNWLN
jgi:hypothetical protein